MSLCGSFAAPLSSADASRRDVPLLAAGLLCLSPSSEELWALAKINGCSPSGTLQGLILACGWV